MKALNLLQVSSLFYIGVLALVLAQIHSVQAQNPSYSMDYNQYIFFHWKGALTSHSITLKIFPNLTQLNATTYNTYIALYTKSADTKSIVVTSLNQITFNQTQYSVAELVLGSLTDDAQYFYCFVFVNGANFNSSQFQTIYSGGVPTEFNFTTLGVALIPYSFTFGAASCASTGSQSAIFTTLANQGLDFFIHMGDMHYSDIAENNISKIYDAYFKVFASPTQKSFFQSTPIFYVWDDHDFGAGNANGTSPSNPAVNMAYRNFIPHGSLKNRLPSDDSLAFPNDDVPKSEQGVDYLSSPTVQDNTGVFQSFIVGRCLFIIMDLRSYKDVLQGDILGSEQTSWLENQFRYAGNNDGIVQVFLVSSFPWIHQGKPTEWSAYPAVQDSIAKLVKLYLDDTDTEIMMLSGDAHMIAFDDGTNNLNGGFPVVQAAAMDRWGSCKGGPYSHGFETGPNHYSYIEVIDYGDDRACVNVNLRNQDQTIIAYETCNKAKYQSNLSYCPVTTNTVPTEEEGGFSLTIIICVLIILIGLISWFVYDRSRKQQQRREQPTHQSSNYYELMDTPTRRSANN